MLKLTLDDIAHATALAKLTVWHYEQGKKVQRSTAKLIIDYYASLGVIFNDEGAEWRMTVKKPAPGAPRVPA